MHLDARGLEKMRDYIIPVVLGGTALFSLAKKKSPYDALVEGGTQGLKLLVSILPSLILLLTAVRMLQASGAMKELVSLCTPLLSRLGIPGELAPLILIRPISGSAALAVGADLIAQHGPESAIGRCAAIMLGSTETTFYTISVYFGAAGIKKTRYAVPAALFADLTGFVVASLTERLFF